MGKVFNPLTSKSKHFYKLLISKKVRVSRGFTKWKENFCLDDTAVSKAFLVVRPILSETFIKSFQLKILNDITFTNHHLAKIGYVQNGLTEGAMSGAREEDTSASSEARITGSVGAAENKEV